MDNHTMMQYFEWNLPADGILWERVGAQAAQLKEAGIDIIWLPPAYKGAAGMNDVGYSVYDLYDVGEFNQKGNVSTKYGTKAAYLGAIKALQAEGIKVVADIVLNQRIGADSWEMVPAEKVNPDNRKQEISGEYQIEAWTKFDFPGRQGKYSDFTWDWHCFTGIDWDASNNQGGIYQFQGKEWAPDVDSEKGNFDYLMGADVDMENPQVIEELIRWGKWYLDTSGIDGLRLDAVKHISYDFYKKWVEEMQQYALEKLFIVGEYWSGDVKDLRTYLENSQELMRLFDVPLHYNFFHASNSNGRYNMAELFQGSLVEGQPDASVTFVDNHDSQPGSSLESWILEWFKPQAYAAILLRAQGTPCVFYGDYYGLREEGEAGVPGLRRMLATRKLCAYGTRHDYLDHESVIGWTLEGDTEHNDSGLAVVMTDSCGGEKQMYIGKSHSGERFRDITGRTQAPVTIDGNGNGAFSCPDGGVSVWIKESVYRKLVINLD